MLFICYYLLEMYFFTPDECVLIYTSILIAIVITILDFVLFRSAILIIAVTCIVYKGSRKVITNRRRCICFEECIQFDNVSG